MRKPSCPACPGLTIYAGLMERLRHFFRILQVVSPFGRDLVIALMLALALAALGAWVVLVFM